KQGDKTENKDKGKSPIVTITRFRDLNAEFEECTNNSSNGVNAASSSVSTAGHNFINSTNDFSAAGPSNITASPTVANSSSQGASTSSHDSDMPNLEDLTHSNDADDVGAEADINNLESIISTMNYHPVLAENQTNSHAGFQDSKKAGEEGTQTYVLFPVLSNGSTNHKNNNKDAHADGKEHDDDIQKSVSSDIHSLRCGDQTREQGDKTENKDKGKSPVVTITGFRDLNEEFEECINNSSNGVSAAGPSVFAAGLDFTNSTNDFSAASPSVSATELNFTNSTNDFSATGPSNADMPNLEDLSHNTDNVGAEADTNNMESIISTRSMEKGVRDQGGISQMFNEDLHTCMFACFLSQEEPKRVHQALKDPSWIEAMQEELLQFKMQKV
nr:putative ribonuclease H-like domain-containing protein [Tanacetum cinerariifolium]